jgi:hypothetical protein
METDYETKAYGSRGGDTEQALRCLEDALDLLALEGPGLSLERVAELVSRAVNLLDRDYGYESDDFDPRRELDFNDHTSATFLSTDENEED